jgi:hypothetical protein
MFFELCASSFLRHSDFGIRHSSFLLAPFERYHPPLSTEFRILILNAPRPVDI